MKRVEAEASVQEVEAVEEAGEEGLDEAGDWSLPSLYKPPSPTGLNTL